MEKVLPTAGELLADIKDQRERGVISEQQALSRIAKDVSPRVKEALRTEMSPRGHFNIPDLLDERRMQFGIPDCAFYKQPIFETVHIWQIPEVGEEEETTAGGIIKPDTTMRNQRERSCRGILIGAGLRALDVMKGNDITLGDIVTMLRLSPWRMHVGQVSGIEQYVLVTNIGTLTSCEGTGYRLHTRKIDVKDTAKPGKAAEHRYYDPETGKVSCAPLPSDGNQDMFSK